MHQSSTQARDKNTYVKMFKKQNSHEHKVIVQIANAYMKYIVISKGKRTVSKLSRTARYYKSTIQFIACKRHEIFYAFRNLLSVLNLL